MYNVVEAHSRSEEGKTIFMWFDLHARAHARCSVLVPVLACFFLLYRWGCESMVGRGIDWRVAAQPHAVKGQLPETASAHQHSRRYVVRELKQI